MTSNKKLKKGKSSSPTEASDQSVILYTITVTEDEIKQYIERAVQLKGSFYGNTPTVTPEELESEAQMAMTEFSRVVQDEVERINAVAEMENERIVARMTTEEATLICPLCLDDIPPLISHERRHKRPRMMPCCGIPCCSECTINWERRQVSNGESFVTCFCCRAAIPKDPEFLPREAIKAGKGWALRYLADAYAMGKCGKRRNMKLAIELCHKAAELGDADAQSYLAMAYYHGHYMEVTIHPSLPRSQELAEKAVEQGSARAQGLLPSILQDTRSEKAFLMYTLASFQGDYHGRFNLAITYMERAETLRELVNEDFSFYYPKAKRCLLLSIYWFGKAAEVDQTDNTQALFLMICQLSLAMVEWHKRRFFDVEPLSGYSHIPFSARVFRKREKDKDATLKGKLTPCDYWRYVCANCGSRDVRKFKVCARCKCFSYCSKECQVKHWKAGHKVDCKGHWIEKFFPELNDSRKGN
jgi:hypothetical protein